MTVKLVPVLNKQVENGKRNGTIQHKSNQAVLLHAAPLFDIKECGLDWINKENRRSDYNDLLIDFVVLEIPDVVGYENEQDDDYKGPLVTLRNGMVNGLEKTGRKEPNHTLRWWQWIENSTVKELRRNKLYAAPIFIDFVRAFLSIQISSAPSKNLFSDAGYQEGIRRQNEELTMTEMLLFIRDHVRKRLKQRNTRREFISSTAESVQEVAEEIERSITVGTIMNM